MISTSSQDDPISAGFAIGITPRQFSCNSRRLIGNVWRAQTNPFLVFVESQVKQPLYTADPVKISCWRILLIRPEHATYMPLIRTGGAFMEAEPPH